MRRDADTPAQYVASLDGAHKRMVTKLRRLVKRCAPTAREGLKYGMLHYELNGDMAALAAQKHYVSLYVMVEDALKQHQAELEGVDCGKCCLRLRHEDSIPMDTIESVLRTAAKLGGRAPAKR